MAGWFGFRLDWLVFWMVILVGFVGWVGLVCISDFDREAFLIYLFDLETL